MPPERDRGTATTNVQRKFSEVRARNSYFGEKNYVSIAYRFRIIASDLSKVADFNLPHLHLAPPLAAAT